VKRSILMVVVAACSGSPAGPPAQSTLTGTVADGTTLTGVISMSGTVTVPSGATVTVAAGTIIEAAQGSHIDVAGTLSLAGEKGNTVQLIAANTGDFWNGVTVTGTYEMHYGQQIGGGLFSQSGGSTTVIDSELSDNQGDFLVADGGAIDVEHTNLGGSDTNSHCNIHINSVDTMTFTHSSIDGSVFGLMLYGGASLDFTANNWSGNSTDIEPGASGTASFDGDYFASGLPAGVQGSSFANLSTSSLIDVGPR
jgi:hypothetical protein